MIPLRDENPIATVPVVTRALIVVNAAAFLYEVMLGPDLHDFLFTWGLVPARIHLALAEGFDPGFWTATALTFVTSMFLHGGWMHLLGNMWYLWIFGDNIEDRLGHVRYVFFYLAAGLVAALLQFMTHPESRVPTIGASGAIAGVLGAYAAAYPRARVVTLVPIFPFFQVVPLPALVVLGLWFVFQFVLGAFSLGSTAGAGVAWWAHIGGFAFGFVVVRFTGRRQSSRAWVDG
jgi:membrane associated rhomboid family serine protease